MKTEVVLALENKSLDLLGEKKHTGVWQGSEFPCEATADDQLDDLSTESHSGSSLTGWPRGTEEPMYYEGSS